jgi:HJR/Mrr/RecB family endonuclease
MNELWLFTANGVVVVETSFEVLNESIIQCAGGRCNRNAQNKNLGGEVIIVELMDELNNNRLFCTYIYDNVLLSITRNILTKYSENVSINEKDTVSQIDIYFKKVQDSKENKPIIEDMKNLHFDKVKEFELIEKYIVLSAEPIDV